MGVLPLVIEFSVHSVWVETASWAAWCPISNPLSEIRAGETERDYWNRGRQDEGSSHGISESWYFSELLCLLLSGHSSLQ